MMKKSNLLRIMFFICMAICAITMVICLSCTTNVVSGTSGSETGNGKIIGFIYDTSGKGVPNTEVILLPYNYDPCKDIYRGILDTTDATGAFSFGCCAGNYSLQALQLSNRTRAYHNLIYVDTNGTISVNDTLKKSGSIKLIFSDAMDYKNGYIYIPGTTIFSSLDKNSNFVVLDSVPAGNISAICYATTSGLDVKVFKTNIELTSGSTLEIMYPEWKYNQKLYLNTTETGVLINSDVTSFPLLIKLTKQNFNFDQSFGDGFDLYFTNLIGKRLPFEIERWNRDSGLAEIWVNLDTVKANSNSQYIIMYWGNPELNTHSDGTSVFDTASGFQGVWHLNENPSEGKNAIKDRTYNQNHGTKEGNNEVRVINGIIGQALNFSNPTGAKGSSIKLPESITLDQHGTIMISCWIRIDGNSTDSFGIIGKFSYEKDSANKCISKGYSLFCNSAHYIQLQIGFGTEEYLYLQSDSRITDNNWHHVVGIITPVKMSLFIDGVKKDVTFSGIPTPSTIAGVIGSYSYGVNGDCFIGDIDEVRICNLSRSVDWIKLSYSNQKMNDMLVVRK